MNKVSITETNTRYTKRYYIEGNDLDMVQQSSDNLLMQYPTIGYSTSASSPIWSDTNQLWRIEVTRSHHCD